MGNATGNDTNQIQGAINSCAGGGEVRLQSGQVYTAGTIRIKSNVTLNLNGATLQTSGNIGEFSSCKPGSNRRFFICAEKGTRNIGIKGPGTIRQGPDTDFSHSYIETYQVSGIKIQGTPGTQDLVVGSPSERCVVGVHDVNPSQSSDVLIENIKVLGNQSCGFGGSAGNDGINLQSVKNATVRNCFVEVNDDGLAISTSGPYEVSNVLVENCTLSSSSAAIKFGTGTEAPMRNITFRNTTLRKSRNTGIRFTLLDGGSIENVRFSNITIKSDVNAWIACGRGGTGGGDCVTARNPGGPLGFIRDIIFENFNIEGGGAADSSINMMDRVTFRGHNFNGANSRIVFKNICGLSIFNLTGDQNVNVKLESGVTNVRYDGGVPNCGGSGGPTNTPAPTPTKKPTSTPTAGIPGDLDKDGDVDIFDYNILVENFGLTSCGNIADIDGNCKVDIFDYNILVENFGL